MPQLKLLVLGAPYFEQAEQALDIERRKVKALLIYLAVTAQPQQREKLAALLWPDSEQRRALGSLRRHLFEINKLVAAEILETNREMVWLKPSAPIWLDVQEFEQLLDECQSHEHAPEAVCADCVALLSQAVDLYRDDFLTGFTLPDCPDFDDWQFFQTESLRQELATALERLVRAYQSRGDYTAAFPYARRWLSLDPLSEPVHRQLMQLYDQIGQRAAALRQYQLCVQILDEELGLPPETETTALYEIIRSINAQSVSTIQAPDSLSCEPTAPPSQTNHNLPTQVIPFIGRENERAQLTQLLDDQTTRLVAIVGPGGVGKTRLALETARARLDQYRYGVTFVPLAQLASVELLFITIAEALHFSLYEGNCPQ